MVVILVVALLLGTFVPIFFFTSFVYAQSPIVIGDPQVTNDFPRRFVIAFPVRSSAGDIVNVRGRVRFGIRPIYRRVILEFAPGRETTATWEWDTSRITVPPYVPIEIQLEVKDSQGNVFKSRIYSLAYEDNRFRWRERRSQHLIVRWYEGSDAFGEEIFELARNALQRQIDALGIVPDRPLVLVIYANEEDFFAWHSYRTEWVGGQAFPEFGVAAQIIPPDSRPEWIYDVIPHELNHLLVDPYIRTPLGRVPSWFEEGLAQYFEQTSAREEHERLKQAVKAGYLLPLGVMRSSPGQDPEEVYLWYAQALSMVEWLIERHGEAKLRAYIQRLHEGKSPSKAFREAFGETEEEFYASWREYVGLPLPVSTPVLVFALTPTSGPMPVFTPSLVLEGTREGVVVDSKVTTRTNTPVLPPTLPPQPPETSCFTFSLLGVAGITLLTFAARKN